MLPLLLPLLTALLLFLAAPPVDASAIIVVNGTEISLSTQSYFLAPPVPYGHTGMLLELVPADGCSTLGESPNATAVTSRTWTRVFNETILFAAWGNALRRGCDTYAQLTSTARAYSGTLEAAGLPPAVSFMILLGPRPAALEDTEGSPLLEGYAAHSFGILDGPVLGGWDVSVLGTNSSTQLVSYVRASTASGRAASARVVYEIGPWNAVYQSTLFIVIIGILTALAAALALASLVFVGLSIRRAGGLFSWTRLAVLIAAIAATLQAASLQIPRATLAQSLVEAPVHLLANLALHLLVYRWAASLPRMKSRYIIFSLIALSAVLSLWLPSAAIAQLFMRATLPPSSNLGPADYILFAAQLTLALAVPIYAYLIWKGLGTAPSARKDGSLPPPFLLPDTLRLSTPLFLSLLFYIVSAALSSRILWPLLSVRPLMAATFLILTHACLLLRLSLIALHLDPRSQPGTGARVGIVPAAVTSSREVGTPQKPEAWHGVDLWGEERRGPSTPAGPGARSPPASPALAMGYPFTGGLENEEEEEEEDEADLEAEREAAAYVTGVRESAEAAARAAKNQDRESVQSGWSNQWVAEEYVEGEEHDPVQTSTSATTSPRPHHAPSFPPHMEALSEEDSYGTDISLPSESTVEVGIGRRVSIIRHDTLPHARSSSHSGSPLISPAMRRRSSTVLPPSSPIPRITIDQSSNHSQ